MYSSGWPTKQGDAPTQLRMQGVLTRIEMYLSPAIYASALVVGSLVCIRVYWAVATGYAAEIS
jgi:hypothetical protein